MDMVAHYSKSLASIGGDKLHEDATAVLDFNVLKITSCCCNDTTGMCVCAVGCNMSWSQ